MRRRRDEVDVAAEEWARIMRSILEPRRSSEILGAPRCTLAARRDLHHGARSGRVEQRWPEFPFARASDGARIVHALYRSIDEPLAEILLAHWVVVSPRDKRLRADLMGLSHRQYWDRLGRVRAAIQGALLVGDSVRTLLGPKSTISATVRSNP